MLRPLEAPFRYLFGPGPSNVPPRVLAAGGRPIIGHLHSEMYEVKKNTDEGYRFFKFIYNDSFIQQCPAEKTDIA